MKRVTLIFMLLMGIKLLKAQDTAYVSRDKATALFFPSLANVISSNSNELIVTNKGNGVLTIRARSSEVMPQTLSVQEENTKKVYRITVVYSYGRAGRRVGYGSAARSITYTRPERTEQIIAQQLAAGKRSNVAAHKKAGSVKAWISKISLAGSHIYLRLDLRNRSNLPYGIDFVRFYIRDRKTVSRMATHEQEIVPLYSTLYSRTAVVKGQEIAKVFAFKRFSLSDDEALSVEVYERSGNRHFYLQIKEDDLDDINVIPVPRNTAQTLAAN